MCKETYPHAWQRYGLLESDPFLAFLNTVDDPGKSRKENGIPTMDLALDWAETAAIVSASERQHLRSITNEKNHASLLAFREAGWTTLAHVARRKKPPAKALGQVDAMIGDSYRRTSLVRKNVGFKRIVLVSPNLMLDRLALCADALMRSSHLEVLQECRRCTALFLDTGRGRPRRYCRVATCGNRAKVERFRAK